jgi:hypothetical protein
MLMPSASFGAPALNVPAAAALLAVGVVVAALLAHALRKVRSDDWVVAFGWGLGGAVAVGTGLWLLQTLAWRQALPGMAQWFSLQPFVMAWLAAVTGVAVSLFVSRWMPSHRVANPSTLLVLLPTLVVVYVLAGAALSQPPRWDQIAAGPSLGALSLAALGLGAALHLLNGPRQRWIASSLAQRAVGTVVFALALLLALDLGLSAAPLPAPAWPRW